MRIELPDFCVVMLIGPSGSGKTNLARRLFKDDEVLSSDYFRKLVCGNESDQGATEDAFDCLYHVAAKRLDRRKLTVIDATNLGRWARGKALDFARDNNCFCMAIVCNIPESDCLKNNSLRSDRQTPANVIGRQCGELRQALKSIKKENFRQIHVLNSLEEANGLEIVRTPLWPDLSWLHGPFDIIGDVHGCYAELCELLRKLGYDVRTNDFMAIPPQGRKAVFLGDLCDRGPANVAVLRLVMDMVEKDFALCVPGNHDDKLLRYLEGRKIQIAHGLECTLAEIEREDRSFRNRVKDFLRKRISHYLLDNGKLVVCHAGLPANLQGRSSKRVREFCLYGDPTGQLDEYGLPERNDWARDYRGQAFVAYGHTPEPQTRIANNTICLDAGCVFGGNLSALRYPEMEIVTVHAKKEYCHSSNPLTDVSFESLPDTQELLKRRRIETGLGMIVIRDEERSIAALEIMGRFAADPRWLIYLPPTMSPCETSGLPDYLEHPLEALSYYKTRGVNSVICQEKHMGSRAVAIICKDEQTAEKRFASSGGNGGMILTRTGRPFFTSAQKQIYGEFLRGLRSTLEASGFWREYDTDWVCLDCEIMPWSFKAQSLVATQYAPYGIAGVNGLETALGTLQSFTEREKKREIILSREEAMEMANLRSRLQSRLSSVRNYNKVWKSYCHPVSDVSDIKIAPFHILATAGKVWSDTPHDQHLNIIARSFGNAAAFIPTKNVIVNPATEEGMASAVAFWNNLLAGGGEGMVVKPLDFVGRNGTKLIQPAIKCRGKEYLRIIYGAEYTEKIEALKQRSLTGKRKRALREFALGLEALERFVKDDALHNIHECVFTILALESEPQDARL